MMEEYDYDAFGKPHFYSASSGWSWDLGYSEFGNRFLFTGREWLKDLRLYDFRNRLYHPELGRFLQPDPKEFAAGDYNLYRYCHNDPVNKSDPMGLEPLAKGLIDIPEKALRQTYDNGKDAANQSLRNNDRRSQTERRTDTFNDNGKVRNTGTTTGYKWPSPQAPPPKLPPGVPESARLRQAHDHVGSPAKHYGGDKASANDAASGGRFPLGSGVSSTSDRGVTQEFYIPSANQADRAANRGGAFFITNDGIHFTPAPYHP
jgi:RHS repeat-associated protein